MQEIDDLGGEIEQAWADVQYRTDEFASIAQTALKARVLPSTMSIDRICRWFALSSQIPYQSWDASFGEPPIQLYSGRRFYIEALFWTDGTTTIHQHSFSGAFQVLLGGSIHTTYSFQPRETISRHLLLGDLAARSSELLHTGDIRRIDSGDRLIHSLFHLERPSLTLVVRTKFDAGTDPQYNYLPPGIACSPMVGDDRASRLLRLLDVLEPRSPVTVQLLADLFKVLDLETVVAMLMHWSRAHPIDTEVSEALLEIVSHRHGAMAATLRSAIQEARRQALIVSQRRSNHRADLRFFLALLLNLNDRDRILQFVAQQYPEKSPIDQITDWCQELLSAAAVDVAGTASGARPAFGLDEAAQKVLRYLLEEQTPEQVVTALSEEYDDVDEQRVQILDLCAALSDVSLLRPLFRGSP